MVQSPSWEANWFAASQEIPRISRNPKVNYRTHKRPPPVSILGQPNPVHIPTSHLLEIRSKIIPHLRLGLPSDLLPSGFPTKTLYTPSPHPYVQHAQPISFFSILWPAQYWVRWNIVSYFFLFVCGCAKCLSREQCVAVLCSSCSLLCISNGVQQLWL